MQYDILEYLQFQFVFDHLISFVHLKIDVFFCATGFRSDVTYYYPLLFYYGALFVKVYVFRILYVVGLRIDCPSKFYQTEEYIYSTHS